MFTKRAPAPTPEAVPIASLATTAANGLSGGSGHVLPWRALTSGYANGDMLAEDIGQHVLVTGNPSIPDLPADSLYANRAMRGGVRTEAPTNGQYRLSPAFLGGHVMMTNRPPLVLIDGPRMEVQTVLQPTGWRDAPAVVDLCRRGSENVPGGLAGVRTI